ncbi:glucosamine 6-phosphate N-acetyltransferase 1-like [Phoenix dactylifera]|uniref:Glucosamine 6-phosphate N-acetyltransferase n=1 Tax=Phoenix dactylifera TaxID=42345 RepID=A0A8B9A011_PHODC|nr:glucosamine 6-phosphate N-acetyltransferase 1-like [Phoenix dactylifera]XP_038977151.1 glucosamine 6-phosphate N-acetyltransferase 1-like [Phoenix dactylifera]XP_038977152.1 glucosamine 6-phosphate N-acetyltransferase 1-like [Phoenix dactylifera]XP_038977153.1 glucosamine 6-phosphate N-acetyltransferase 1-like [Phoenix dactylifera]XP_038977154.1 glucosamine 6-phosphate N-acetyltransferase 1-like [Phoenix dactylifera]XP_038977155.1 glucosamine 6-phosphate N-acetyltransferase 1-like [Phoenix 
MESRTPPAAADAGCGRGDDDLLPIRRLEISDNSKGFVELLAQLSHCPPLSDADFRARFADIAALGDDHVICVVEDLRAGRIVATGSVFIERKFLRGCGMVGHIEDVVVDAAIRGRRLGQRVVRYLVEHARAAGCYKVILDCDPDLRAFYEKCGFSEKSVQMALYF